jgi:FlaA1/EpsC-like NDP-sugar epimerase
VTLAFVAGVYVTVRHLARAELWDTGWVLVDGLRRPSPMLVASILYPAADFVALSLALLLMLRLAAGQAGGMDLGTRWVNELPIWVAPPFIGLLAAGAHSRVWSRARMSDYMMLGTGLVAGTAVGTGLSLLLGPLVGSHLAGGAGPLVYLGLSALFVIGGRMWMRGVHDFMALTVHRQSGKGEGVERVLLCGAGHRCKLFLADRAASLAQRSRPAVIVGIIDEDPNLRKRQVYGYRVIGTPHEIREVIRASHVDRIVLTEPLSESSRTHVMQTACEAGVRVSEWCCEERAVER